MEGSVLLVVSYFGDATKMATEHGASLRGQSSIVEKRVSVKDDGSLSRYLHGVGKEILNLLVFQSECENDGYNWCRIQTVKVA